MLEETTDGQILRGGRAALFVNSKTKRIRYCEAAEIEYTATYSRTILENALALIARLFIYGNVTGLIRYPVSPRFPGPQIQNFHDNEREVRNAYGSDYESAVRKRRNA